MTVFKCKICGGTLEVLENESIFECQYCGSIQTLPKLTNSKINNLYDRANHLRRNNEFDKALGLYENILLEDPTDAEVYWSIVLCKYGIEYVEDPQTKKRVPTIHRAQYTSILADTDYKLALQYADEKQKTIYEQDANYIDDLQKGILEISLKEEPFDVFICYKESDEQGNRTVDSALASELYYELTEMGIKTFFSRITLEDKLGIAYEPYIFAALNSAKVMVVIGTKAEYLQAVWVKNEWNRYLSLIKNGEDKLLIPAYKGMDPYDLPEEFSHLQALDMNRLGFMFDLMHVIKKIINGSKQEVVETKQVEQIEEKKVKEKEIKTSDYKLPVNVDALLERAFMFLEDEDWEEAEEYCEKVLDYQPKNAMAYVGKLLADLGVKKLYKLKDYKEKFDNNRNYQRAIQFADDKLRKELQDSLQAIIDRDQDKKYGATYERAKKYMHSAEEVEDWRNAIALFEKTAGYKDSNKLLKKCIEGKKEAELNEQYEEAKKLQSYNRSMYLKAAIDIYESLADYKDSQKKLEESKVRYEKLVIDEENEQKRIQLETEIMKKRTNRTLSFVIPIVIVAIIFCSYLIQQNNWNRQERLQNAFMEFIESEQYDLAYGRFLLFSDRIELSEELSLSMYELANYYYNDRNYISAKKVYSRLGKYSDSIEKISLCDYYLELNTFYSKFQDLQKNDRVNLGMYTRKYSSSPFELEWVVLDRNNDQLLITTTTVLDRMIFSDAEYFADNNWEKSTIRKWLNEDFYNDCFNELEKKMITEKTVVTYKYGEKDIENNSIKTQDKIFIMSYDELRNISNENKGIKYKSYSYFYDEYYWTRTPCKSDKSLILATFDAGWQYADDFDVYGNVRSYYYVRPTMWIDISKIEELLNN